MLGSYCKGKCFSNLSLFPLNTGYTHILLIHKNVKSYRKKKPLTAYMYLENDEDYDGGDTHKKLSCQITVHV